MHPVPGVLAFINWCKTAKDKVGGGRTSKVNTPIGKFFFFNVIYINHCHTEICWLILVSAFSSSGLASLSPAGFPY